MSGERGYVITIERGDNSVTFRVQGHGLTYDVGRIRYFVQTFTLSYATDESFEEEKCLVSSYDPMQWPHALR